MVQRSSQSKSDDDGRKLRNRLSQQAFRRRQAEYIKDLEEQVISSQRPDCEAIQALQQENGRLRKELVEVQTRLSRLIAKMQALSGSVSSALDDDSQEQNLSGASDQDGPMPRHTGSLSSHHSCNLTQETADRPVSGSNHDASTTITRPSQPESLTSLAPIPKALTYTEWMIPDADLLTQQMPNIWDYEHQMGTQPYMDAVSNCRESSIMLGKSWAETNSPFSDHIYVLQNLLRRKMEKACMLTDSHHQFLYRQVMIVLSLFNSITRPDVMAWYSKTRFYHIVDLEVWKLLPSPGTLDKVFFQYRPTQIQRRNRYPAVIDWIPFPSIRDRLIRLHSANPEIDQIFCNVVSSYVVEARMSDLVMNASEGRAYIRVTDLIKNIDPELEQDEMEWHNLLPAPEVSTIFENAAYSYAVFRLLNMNRGASYYKIDPAFFGKYPELYDQNANIIAEGIPLRPETQVNLSFPKRLDMSTFQTYCSFINFSLDAPFKIA